MSAHQAFRRAPVPQQAAQKLQHVTIPAPLRGIVQIENFTFMQPGAAIVLDNWLPTTRGIKLRGGCVKWCQLAETTPVISAFEYVSLNDNQMFAADFGRVSAAPHSGSREIWTLKNGGGGWDHPIHIHFEECQTLARNGSAANVPAWEKGRKDVWRLRPGGSVTLTLQFRDWGGMFMEHCHNTVHEDNAMLLRWEIDDNGAPFVRPLPTPIPFPQGVQFRAPTDIEPTALK